MSSIIVGVADMKVSDNPDITLVTYSLGSCIGIVVHDSVARVGGILHFMLPESKIDFAKARTNPFMFADTGIPLLFRSAYKLGAKKQRMKVVVIGGSQILDQNGFFNIGKRNYLATKKILWKNNVLIDYEDIGGSFNRTSKLAVKNGKIIIKVSGKGEIET